MENDVRLVIRAKNNLLLSRIEDRVLNFGLNSK